MSLAASNTRKQLEKSTAQTKRTKRGQRKGIFSGERPKHKGYRQLQESEQAAIKQVETLQKQLKAANQLHRRDVTKIEKMQIELKAQAEKNSALQERQQNSERTCSLLSSALEVRCCTHNIFFNFFSLVCTSMRLFVNKLCISLF